MLNSRQKNKKHFVTSFTEACSLTNEKKYDINNNTQKHLLFKQFVAWTCNDCTLAPTF